MAIKAELKLLKEAVGFLQMESLGVGSIFQDALKVVSENIRDERTDFKKKRTITLKIPIQPVDAERTTGFIGAEVSTALAPRLSAIRRLKITNQTLLFEDQEA